MGYTEHTVNLIEKAIRAYHPQSVIDAGAQNMYNQPYLPAPYASGFYEWKGIDYQSVDLSGENGSHQWDLGTELKDLPVADLFVCAGTKEHVGHNGAFSWDATYNCFLNYHRMTKVGGIQIHENPKTGHWPFHGFSFYTEDFYHQLSSASGYRILEIGECCAMGNCETGRNIWCVMEKTSEEFPTLDTFKTFSLKTS